MKNFHVFQIYLSLRYFFNFACFLNISNDFVICTFVILKLIFGEMSEILLKGNKISSQKIISSGFKFNFLSFENALINLL